MIRNRKNNLNSTTATQKRLNNSYNQDHTLVHFLQSPKNTSSKLLIPKQHHYASNTQLIYTPFQKKNMYVPPHLNASQIFNCMQSECQSWKVRPSSAKKLNYDKLYKQNEKKYDFQSNQFSTTSKLKKTAKSKIIKYIEQDRQRNRKPHKWYIQSQSQQEENNDSLPQYEKRSKNNSESQSQQNSSFSNEEMRKHQNSSFDENSQNQCKKCSKISKKLLEPTQKLHIEVQV